MVITLGRKVEGWRTYVIGVFSVLRSSDSSAIRNRQVIGSSPIVGSSFRSTSRRLAPELPVPIVRELSEL
jgi:hypothetical protein